MAVRKKGVTVTIPFDGSREKSGEKACDDLKTILVSVREFDALLTTGKQVLEATVWVEEVLPTGKKPLEATVSVEEYDIDDSN